METNPLPDFEDSLSQWLDEAANNDLINKLINAMVAVFDAFVDIQKPQDTTIMILEIFSKKIEELQLGANVRKTLETIFLTMLRETAVIKHRECLVGEEATRQLESKALQEYLATTRN